MKESTLKRFLRLERFDEHLELHRLDCQSSHRDLSNYDFLSQKLAELGEQEVRPLRLINGDDLIEMGYAPGPKFTEMLRAAEDAQLEGALHTPEDARAWLRSRYPPSHPA